MFESLEKMEEEIRDYHSKKGGFSLWMENSPNVS